LELII